MRLAEPTIYIWWFEHDEKTGKTKQVEYGAYFTVSQTRYDVDNYFKAKNPFDDFVRLRVQYKTPAGSVATKEIIAPFQYNISTSKSYSECYEIERRI